MKRIIGVFIALGFAVSGFCQSVDERVGLAINGSDWSELRELYESEGENIQTGFLRPLSRFFISHVYNQPDSALANGSSLLDRHQEDLGGALASVVYLMSVDYARTGHYDEAAGLLYSLNEAIRQSGQDSPFVSAERQYHILDSLGGFSVIRPSHSVSVPLALHRDESGAPKMLYVSADINGVRKNVTFDTGAGVNVMSREMAQSVGARFFNTDGQGVHGFSTVSSDFAVVDSIMLADVVFRNVPFHVVDFSSDNEQVNQKIRELDLSMTIGSQMMLPLGELILDFEHGELFIPAEPSEKPSFAPNFYFSQDNLMMLTVADGLSGSNVIAKLDTGSSDTELSPLYYSRNKALFKDSGPTEALHQWGVGGVAAYEAIRHIWNYGIGDLTELSESVYVKMSETGENISYDAVLGLPSLTAHDRVILNFRDMWIRLEDN